ncbi:sugar phosphate isomerase/epimerase family protein [Streptomyces sp. NPDC050145]|uniref:sugar phosphate isomerase/epimerase family protein n=1 Tax=Streptomyces sp. NPDC050145 TaxID=3365602 RepID=UPI0037A23252
MKLAFSTLGVPGLPLPNVLALATEHGYHGVELRAHPEEPVHLGLTPGERADVAAAFGDAGVEVLGVAGYARVAAPGEDEPVLEEMRELVDLAGDIGASYVRVFPGAGEEQDAEVADAAAARRLGSVAAHAADRGVSVLLETHDSHRTGADACRVVGTAGHRSVGVLWDVMHTWLGGEQPGETYAAISPYLGYVQVKDIAGDGDTVPLPLGRGGLPLGECVEVLSRAGWDGWLCWEYEARWYDGIPALPGLLGAGRDYVGRLLNESA